MLPDGSLAQVKVDFNTLRDLSRVAREAYGLGGAVQHGASTLPPEAFNNFPEIGTVEIHLATGFQNLIYDNAPEAIVNAAYDYILTHHQHEWKEGKSEEQFLYSTRKKAFGPLKQQWWDLDAAEQEKIGTVLQSQFEFLFDQLNVKETRDIVKQVTTIPVPHRPRPLKAVETPKLEVAGDLAD